MSAKGKIRYYIGTSGWNYKDWRRVFYPEDLDQEEWLSFISEHFDSVEINNSFYQLPDKKTLKTWKETTPDSFVFSVKASRYITHMKKLKDPQESISTFFDHIDVLEAKCGPVLFQLPPKWNANPERLDSFIKTLPSGHRYTFEFRDDSWWTEEIYEILERKNAAFCFFDIRKQESDRPKTADWIYLRLHGPEKNAYQGKYAKNQLEKWKRIIGEFKGIKQVYCYFDNDQKGYAPQNAEEFLKIID